MKYCFILASITGREHLLSAFIESAKRSKYAGADYYLYFQSIDDEKPTGLYDKSFFKDIHTSTTRDGVCLSRMYWLHQLNDYDYYIIVDDDMEFLGKEDYDSVMGFEKDHTECGLCSTLCRRTIAQFEKVQPINEFKVDNVQHIDGGCVFRKDIRDLLVREIDLQRYALDSFCIVTFINGYTNYQYYGSVTLHKAGAKQGFIYVRKHKDEFIPKFEKYIIKTYYDGKLNIPFYVSQLTTEAIELHLKNRK